MAKIPEYRRGDPTFVFATIEFLIDLLNIQCDLVDLVLETEFQQGSKLDLEIRGMQKHTREQIAIVRQNVQRAIEGRQVRELEAWDALSDEALANSLSSLTAEGTENDGT